MEEGRAIPLNLSHFFLSFLESYCTLDEPNWLGLTISVP